MQWQRKNQLKQLRAAVYLELREFREQADRAAEDLKKLEMNEELGIKKILNSFFLATCNNL